MRANQTRAVAADRRGPGCEYLLTSHKWFCSAPMNDAFLVLAQTDPGISCFLVPRVFADGTRNPFAIARLKDTLGNRSRVRQHAWLADRRRRARLTDDRRDGELHASRLHDRLGRAHPRRARAGRAPCDLSLRLWRGADRPSAHAKRASGSGARVGGSNRALYARRACYRRRVERSRRCRAAAEALDVPDIGQDPPPPQRPTAFESGFERL